MIYRPRDECSLSEYDDSVLDDERSASDHLCRPQKGATAIYYDREMKEKVDGPGFEPGASCLQSRRSSELIYPPSVAA